VWPTLVRGSSGVNETLALFYAASKDGQGFTARQQIPTEGVPRHPQIAVGPGGAITIAWDEQAGGSRRIALSRGTVDATGKARFARQGVTDDSSATYPVVATVESGTIVAWTSGATGQTVVRVERVSP